jgi:enoyl-CoA hydratase
MTNQAITGTVLTERLDDVVVITINRPEVRNAVDRPTADLLHDEFVAFDNDDALSVAILTGSEGTFCAGADLKAIADNRGNRIVNDSQVPGPMGPTRMALNKPVIAAVEGHCVAGGLELALWCDLRVAATSATFGVYCRRWGVPLVDGGTVRLPRLIGQSRAMDMILTGRAVGADEAYSIGLANRLTQPGGALDGAIALAREIARFPQICMRSDRRSALDQWGFSELDAVMQETRYGLATVATGETRDGAARFRDGRGRGGQFTDI